jgi:N-acyl homoserine lactone hydrolase
MKIMKIHPVPLFKSHTKFTKPKMTYLSNFGQDLHICCYVWFIQGAGSKILVDAGGNAEMAIARGGPREAVKHVQSLEEGLARLKLKPGDIDIVILTHLHWDHVLLAHEFVNAKFIVQRDELDFACKPHASSTQFYDQDLFSGLNYEVVNGDSQITNGIEVLLTPGHTAGGQSVAIETDKGTAVITGFCSIRENFEPGEEVRKIMPFIVPGIHLNLMQAYESMLKVTSAADIIIPNHDPEFADIDKIPNLGI